MVTGVATYTGQFLMNDFNGIFKAKYLNKDEYEGEIKAGEAHGFGTMKYNSKASISTINIVFKGEFKEGLKDGYGVFTFRNVDKNKNVT